MLVRYLQQELDSWIRGRKVLRLLSKVGKSGPFFHLLNYFLFDTVDKN